LGLPRQANHGKRSPHGIRKQRQYLQQAAALKVLRQRCNRLHGNNFNSNRSKLNDLLNPMRCQWLLQIHKRGKISGKCSRTGR
jgi:hypothetical protein